MISPNLDFKKSEYYEHYLGRLSQRQQDLIIEVMNNNNNEIKYSWKDVLQMVFLFAEKELRQFPEALDVNPTELAIQKEQMLDATQRESNLLLGIENDIS